MKKLLILFFVFSLPIITYSLPSIVITEVSPSEKGGKDCIELFALENIDFSELKNLYIEITHWNTEKTCDLSKVITSTEGVVSKNKFILIYINAEKDNIRFDGRNNLIVEISTTSFDMTKDGMFSTDVIVTLRKSATEYIDAICFSDQDGSTHLELIQKLEKLIEISQWKVENWDRTYSPKWCVSSDKVSESMTLQRRRNFNGLPIDTDTKYDWELRPKTLGYGYKEVVSETQKVVEVDRNTNPFSPEDLENNFVKINFNIEDSEAKKTIVIYDISGKEVIKLLDRDRLPNGDVSTYSFIKAGSITWDGKKLDGTRVPTGVYIVYFEAYNSSTGKKYVGKDVVVVGRKW